MKHQLPERLRSRRVSVLVVGCGGTGSQVLTALAQLDCAMHALGHPGLDVRATDPDTVSLANVGRQMFYPADVGQHKAEVLIHRINLALGTRWEAGIGQVCPSGSISHDLVIGCVDTRQARYAIMRSMERTRGTKYWLDFGNRRDTGQVLLGQVASDAFRPATNAARRLPHIGELFPDAVNATLDGDDDAPSCSLAQALERQSLFINRAVTVHGMNLLWNLFRHGEIEHHGAFVNLRTGVVRPIPVDREYWARLGYGALRTRIRCRDFMAAARQGEPRPG